jgi:hypothetical protein
LAVWLLFFFRCLLFETSTKTKPFAISIFDFNPSSGKKKNLWGYIGSAACKGPGLPLASLLHEEGHRFDFQNFSHANPCAI